MPLILKIYSGSMQARLTKARESVIASEAHDR